MPYKEHRPRRTAARVGALATRKQAKAEAAVEGDTRVVPRRPRLKVGDVFKLMPYGEARHGYGQIVATYGTSGGHFYFAIFSREHAEEDPPLDRIIEDDLALLAPSMDALLHHGYWSVVANAAVDEDRLQWREYKIATAPGIFVVEDAFGTVIREASTKDVALLTFRTVVAPIVVQYAFDALHGEREWLSAYDHLRL
jgi:hypothetical protein